MAEIQVLEPRALLSASFPQFVDPHPSVGDGFGTTIVPLSNGNVVITSPNDTAGGAYAGAAYLFNGTTGALISSVVGSHSGDLSNAQVSQVGNSNYVISDYGWNNGIGAVTWGSGTTGVSGVVSASNSLVGSAAGDDIGSGGVTVLPNGNYLVTSSGWANGTMQDAGAVTFGNGATGVVGVVNARNSLVGSHANDSVGTGYNRYPYPLATSARSQSSSPNAILYPLFSNGVTVLSNGNYTVDSSYWNSDTGAVTFGTEKAGVVGVVGSFNSLTGSTAGDAVGSAGVVSLNNGNYVVDSPQWANGTASNAGAVTWASGLKGISGTVSASNSLVGTTTNDSVGSNGTVELPNGNYLVDSSYWNNGPASSAGAVTFGDGKKGVTGAVSSMNSLVGDSTNDCVGGTNQLFVINFASPLNRSNSTATASAPVTPNAFIPYSSSFGIQVLANGNYLVVSQNWSNGSVTDVGAVTWGSGTKGVVGVVSATNSLVGSSQGDEIGNRGITDLGTGACVVVSPNWSNGSAANAGAVTFVRNSSGFKGVVSSQNSLVGSSAGDFVGSGEVIVLNDGSYVVQSPCWSSQIEPVGTYSYNTGLGAVTWGNGRSGVNGAVSVHNSLVGSTNGDRIGSYGIVVLTNGNYIVDSPYWNNDTGASTWGSETKGVSGIINATNSLIGSSSGDEVGSGAVVQLTNGNYVIMSNGWNSDDGAATWANGKTGIVGVVSSKNSLVGSSAGDESGSTVTALDNGNYVIDSPTWNHDTGAVTWGSGTKGVSGTISSSNSLVGSSTGDAIGGGSIYALPNGNYLVDSPNWANGAITLAGAVTFGKGTTGVHGIVSAANSLVGTTMNDQVGSGWITVFDNSNYLVNSPNWSDAPTTTGQYLTIVAFPDSGAITFGKGTTGILGAITTTNSIIGFGAIAPLSYGGPLVNVNNVDQTFTVSFLGLSQVFVGSQVTGVPTSVIAVFGVDPTPVTFLENAAAVSIAPTIEVATTAGDLTSAKVKITSHYKKGEDLLGFTNTPSITGKWDAATGTLTLTGYGTAADYAAALASVTYQNTSNNPSTQSRMISFSTTDGVNVSRAVTRQVTVVVPPSLSSVTATPLAYTLGAKAIAIAPSIVITDPSSSTLAGATIKITGNFQAGSDVLKFVNTATIKGSWDAKSGTLTLTGVDTLANYQAALRSIQFANPSSKASTGKRTISFMTNDGQQNGNVVTKTIAVKA